MADFMVLAGEHGYEYINLDLVRRITEDMDGNVTLYFDSTHSLKLDGGEAKGFKNDFDRRWREKGKTAAA